MNDDLINREAVIEAIVNTVSKVDDDKTLKDKYDGAVFRQHEILDIIENMPPAQQWIPVTERLPEKREWYWGVFREYDTGWVNPIPYICDYIGCRTWATTKDGWILRNCTDDIDGQVSKYFSDILECVAWMPLPVPYKEEE